MKVSKQVLWTLHNPLKAWTLQGLNLEQAQLVVATFTTAEHNVCLVWQESWENWAKLKSPSCQELFKKFVSVGEAPPQITANVLDDFEDEITQVRPVLKNNKTLINRRHERFEVKIPCEVIVSERVFETDSRDISEGGLCFQNPLPDWVAGYFTVIIKADKPIELTCMIVEDQKRDKYRAEILDSNQAALLTLRDWLENSSFPRLTD